MKILSRRIELIPNHKKLELYMGDNLLQSFICNLDDINNLIDNLKDIKLDLAMEKCNDKNHKITEQEKNTLEWLTNPKYRFSEIEQMLKKYRNLQSPISFQRDRQSMCIEKIKEDIIRTLKSTEKDIRPDVENDWLKGMAMGLNIALMIVRDNEAKNCI